MVARRILSGGARLPDAIEAGTRLTTHAGSRARRLDRAPVRVSPVFIPHQAESAGRTTARYGTYKEAPGNDADEDTFTRHFELDVVAFDEHALERGRGAADLDRSSPAPVDIGQFDREGGPHGSTT